MALTRANAATAISGTITASSVANATVANISAVPSAITTGALTLLSTQTASSSASIEFTSGIDSTYDSYVFKFINIHPSADASFLTFQTSTDGGSSYGVTLTSTFFRAYHDEAGSATALGYVTASDLAQSTSFQRIINDIGNDNDQNGSGTLQLFNLSSTTFVKHWIARTNTYNAINYTSDVCSAGYFNTTSAIDAVKFQMSSGNIDDGIIKMYGVS